MGLSDALRGAANAAIAAVGDIAVSANYLAYATATYDTSGGSPTTTFTTVAGVKVIFQKFRLTQQDGQLVQSGDRRALIAGQAISAITPGINDQIVVNSSVVWEIVKATEATEGVRVAGDPAGALHDLHIRKT